MNCKNGYKNLITGSAALLAVISLPQFFYAHIEVVQISMD